MNDDMPTEGLQWKADLRRAAWAAEADNYEIVDLCSETTELDFSTQHDSEVGEGKENAEPNLQDEKKQYNCLTTSNLSPFVLYKLEARAPLDGGSDFDTQAGSDFDTQAEIEKKMNAVKAALSELQTRSPASPALTIMSSDAQCSVAPGAPAVAPGTPAMLCAEAQLWTPAGTAHKRGRVARHTRGHAKRTVAKVHREATNPFLSGDWLPS